MYFEGNKVIPTIYKDAFGFFVVTQDGTMGCVDIHNDVIIPFEYDIIRSYSEGLFAVRKGRKYGFVNSFNEVVVPFVYDQVEGFEQGKAYVIRNAEAYFIQKDGYAYTAP